jgi:hypothetical protein
LYVSAGKIFKRTTIIDREVILIDRKTIYRSKDCFHEKSPIHIVSAWTNGTQLVPGQLKVDGKSNKMTTFLNYSKFLIKKEA